MVVGMQLTCNPGRGAKGLGAGGYRGLELGARGSRLGARGSGLSGLRARGARGSGLGAWGSGPGARSSGLRARGSGLGARGSGLGVRSSDSGRARGLGLGLATCNTHATHMQHACNTHATQHATRPICIVFCRKCASAIKIFFNEIKSFESCSMPLCTSLPKIVKIQGVACVLHVCCMRVACVLHACCMWPTQAPSPEP